MRTNLPASPNWLTRTQFLWVMVPILLYFVVVPGVWNGVVSDFDATRGAVMKDH